MAKVKDYFESAEPVIIPAPAVASQNGTSTIAAKK
jgi:hypothetical protein